MMAGKPILASYSGYQSMVNEANCGLFVPAEDEEALIKGIGIMTEKSEVELEEMGQRGKDWLIQNRQWNTLADNYLSILDKLVHN